MLLSKEDEYNLFYLTLGPHIVKKSLNLHKTLFEALNSIETHTKLCRGENAMEECEECCWLYPASARRMLPVILD